jgi:fucose permease
VPSKIKAWQLGLTFGVLGAAASLVPASIPQVAQTLDVDQSSLLIAVPLMFAGLFLGVALTPVLVRLVSPTQLAKVGFTLLAATLALLPLSTNATVFSALALVLGLGFGTLEVIATSEARKLREDTSQKLTNLNAVFALSALTAPLLLLLSMLVFGEAIIFFVVAASSLVLAARYQSNLEKLTGPKLSNKRLSPSVIFLMLAALAFVGAESVMSGWSASAVNQLTSLDANSAAIGSSAFWGLLALGRLVSARLSPEIISNRLALIVWPMTAATALLGAAVAWPYLSAFGVLVAFSVAAFAAGPCYALIIGQALDASQQEDSVSLTSTIVLLGAAGGFILPALVQLQPEVRHATTLAGIGFLLTVLFAVASTRKTTMQMEVSV